MLERTPTGPRPLGGGEGAEHPSGADFDEAVLRLVLGGLGDRGRDLKSDNAEARARLAEVRRQCTAAKETLSTAAEAAVTVSLPGYTTTVRLSRREFESLIRPALRDSITMTARVLRGADQPASELAAIVLVGGSHADADRRRPAAARVRGADRAGHPPGVRRGRRCGADRAARRRLRIGRRRPTGRGRRRIGSGRRSSRCRSSRGRGSGASRGGRAAQSLRPRTRATGARTRPAGARGRGAAAEVDESAAAPVEDGTLISAAPVILTPAVDAEDGQPTEALPAADPSSEGAEQMPDHLIFDYFNSVDTDPEDTMPDHAAYLAQPAQAPMPAGAGGPAPTSPGWGPSALPAANAYPPNQPPPARRNGPGRTRATRRASGPRASDLRVSAHRVPVAIHPEGHRPSRTVRAVRAGRAATRQAPADPADRVPDRPAPGGD